ncbi:MAG TPA: hypothetical protein DIU39_03815, partial [Flavobacteriales bacterium]|nr:hypothetical protein [Flavobacteriales bacterium]
YDTWQSMGFPDFLQINTVLSDYMVKLQNYCASKPNVSTVDCRGLMQYHYGQTTPLTVAPYGTYPPYTAPLPGGFPDYPSPKDALGSGGFDSFHLNSTGYKLFVAYQFEHYYFNAITNKAKYKIFADTLGSGSGNSSITDTTAWAGNISGNNYSLQFSFNTSPIPQDTLLHSLQLFLRADSVTENLFDNYAVKIKVKKGWFGQNQALETGDFSDTATVEFSSPCHYGTLAGNEYWIRIDLDSAVENWVNKNGVTQIQISFPNIAGNKAIRFANAHSNHKPFILLNPTLLSSNRIIAETQSNNNISVFPNPSKGLFHISGTNPLANVQIKAFSIDGKLIQKWQNVNAVTLKEKGIYILQIWENENLTSVKKVIVR